MEVSQLNKENYSEASNSRANSRLRTGRNKSGDKPKKGISRVTAMVQEHK